MAVEPITLHVPQHIYERAKAVANATAQSLETVLLQELETAFLPPLPSGEEAELNALNHLSDDALWTIARETMPDPKQAMMQTLMDQNTQGTISADGLKQLEQLVDQGLRLMLRKGKASAILSTRGYTITRERLRE